MTKKNLSNNNYILHPNIGCTNKKKNKSFSKPDYNQDIIMVIRVIEGMPDANLNFIKLQTKKALHYTILIFSATI